MKKRVTVMSGEREMTALDPNFKSEKALAMRAFRDFMSYKEPGYTPELYEVLKTAKNSAEIRDVLRKARTA